MCGYTVRGGGGGNQKLDASCETVVLPVINTSGTEIIHTHTNTYTLVYELRHLCHHGCTH